MAGPGPETHGKFDMSQSTENWNNFLSLAKWVVIGNIILLIVMAYFLTGGQPAH